MIYNHDPFTILKMSNIYIIMNDLEIYKIWLWLIIWFNFVLYQVGHPCVFKIIWFYKSQLNQNILSFYCVLYLTTSENWMNQLFVHWKGTRSKKEQIFVDFKLILLVTCYLSHKSFLLHVVRICQDFVNLLKAWHFHCVNDCCIFTSVASVDKLHTAF